MTARGPLNGITVIDLTRVLAGPFCTMLLADLGARVIKVEQPGKGDDSRRIGPFIEGKSAYFTSLNRGKESIALDLKSQADRRRFEDLLRHADVLTENFRAGTLDKLGYGWDRLHARYPRLVYAATSGFGQEGPYAQRPAYDMVVQAMGGVMSLTGQPGGPPTRVGTSVGDITAGLFTAVAINAALYDRQRTGEGRRVDVSMLDAQVAILENAIARFTATGNVPGPLGSRHPSIVPFQAYAASDGYLIMAAGNDALFRRACEVLGTKETADDPRFQSNEARCRHVDALQETFESILASAPVADWLERLEKAGVPCGPIHNVAQVMQDPQVRARNMIVEVVDAAMGAMKVAGNPMKLSGFPDPTRRDPAPDLDADRERVLRDFGLD